MANSHSNLTSLFTDIASAIREKNGSTGTIVADAFPNAIRLISTGTDTSDATAVASDILSGKTAYVDGTKITGTIATKTASNLTASGATVTVPTGYYASQATKSVATATQATPSISVDSAGKITASATQTAGYVSAGTKSATKQLTVQAAKTVTPNTTSQTAVASGVYTTGAVTVAAIPSTYVKPSSTKTATTYTPTTTNQTIAAGTYCSGTQTIKGDANLLAENIKSGVSIFGVAGTLESGGGGGSGDLRTITVINNTGYEVAVGANEIPNGDTAQITAAIEATGLDWSIGTWVYMINQLDCVPTYTIKAGNIDEQQIPAVSLSYGNFTGSTPEGMVATSATVVHGPIVYTSDDILDVTITLFLE